MRFEEANKKAKKTTQPGTPLETAPSGLSTRKELTIGGARNSASLPARMFGRASFKL